MFQAEPVAASCISAASISPSMPTWKSWSAGPAAGSSPIPIEIYGRGLTRNYVHNLATISETEALPDARLYNAYFEQSFYNNALNIRVGQQAADVEFFDSETDDLFINGTFGWPAIKAANLPAGGPAPPIAALGIRVKAALSDQITAFGAVFNGNAPTPGPDDPQLRDNHGLAFRINDAPWVIGQVRWDYDHRHRRPSARRQLHAGRLVSFRPVRRSALHRAGPVDRRPRAEPASRPSFAAISAYSRPSSRRSTGRLGDREGRFELVAGRDGVRPDRLQPAGSKPDRPLSRRRHRLRRPGSRPSRSIGSARAWPICGFPAPTKTSIATPSSSPACQARCEAARRVLEVIYEAHIKPGWLLAPYFQYVFRPSGGIPNPNDPSGLSRIGDAAVFGVTTTLRY